jgi:hypothetical protein
MPDQYKLEGGKAHLVKDDGTTVELDEAATAKLLQENPGLLAKAACDHVMATTNIHTVFRDVLHPVMAGALDIGDHVMVRASGELGEVQRIVDDAIRVKMSDGRIETRWPIEVEKRA